ncbi:hypothetical protein JOQ06_021061, partial [Pogonophryne albipinna]
DLSFMPPHTHTNPLQASLLWAIPGESRTFKRVPVTGLGFHGNQRATPVSEMRIQLLSSREKQCE